MGKKEEEYVPAPQMFRRALEKTLEALQALKDAHYATSKAHGFSGSTESTLFDSVVPVVNIAATLLAGNVAFIEEQEKKWANRRACNCLERSDSETEAHDSNCEAGRLFPQLDEDAPPVPPGMAPRDGVEYGCGKDTCRDCYVEE